MAPRAAILSALFLIGCFPPGEGVDPPDGRVYFPVGLAIDEKQKFLYVVNSDFDLQFNAGTVQSWDLDALRRLVPHYCSSDADCEAEGRVCDLPAEEMPVFEPDSDEWVRHQIENRGMPSHWCVLPGERNGDDIVPGTPCGPRTDQSNREQSLYPGRCKFISQFVGYGGTPIVPVDSNGAVVAGRSVKIGAFATDVVRRTLVLPAGWTVPPDDLQPTEDEPLERLFIPVRGDATLHWIDIRNGELDCAQGGNDGACDGRHRSGDDPDAENTRNSGRLQPEPFGVAADENGLTVMVTNQTSGTVSLFSTPRKDKDVDGNPVAHIDWNAGPRYVFPEGGLPDRPIGIANLPPPLAVPSSGRQQLPGYLVSFRNASRVYMLRVYDDDAADPVRPYTRAFESSEILTNSSGIDSRGIGIDAFKRKAQERACLERYGVTLECATDPSCARVPELQACLEQAALTPLEVFLANRAPSSLVLGRSQPLTERGRLVSDTVTSDLPAFYASLPLDLGPSRVYVGAVLNEQGERERRVFVTCFDSRRIAIYDPERGRLETEVITGRGPQALAIDIGEDHAYAYVGHFLDSYVGVVDLDQRHRGQYGVMIASIAQPVAPRASK